MQTITYQWPCSQEGAGAGRGMAYNVGNDWWLWRFGGGEPEGAPPKWPCTLSFVIDRLVSFYSEAPCHCSNLDVICCVGIIIAGAQNSSIHFRRTATTALEDSDVACAWAIPGLDKAGLH
ncbi:hypothetical protein AMATHDRAFT_58347 [Amanita thiersii Skay4041]|uniref:Uncharacterized protein n=1 Tax=Amanita thiersii Skay4041 TaxID=703135 RepID=A0A2A9NVS0_9AGAR|nr:hypothetical protein AMATHDRAFT_58347 [Amanita thiersii Skay4041]